jgi:hypothetical protein
MPRKPKPPKPTKKPAQPQSPKLLIWFVYNPETRKAMSTGHVTPSAAVSTDQDNDLQIVVSLNGGANTVLDCGPPPGNPVTFPCNAGDTYSITQVDYNVVGASPASSPLTGTVPTILPPPTSVPTVPGMPAVTFTNP